MSKDAHIVFTPSGKRGDFPIGTPVLTAARNLGVDIDSVCGGRGICGRCQVEAGEGEFAKHKIVSSCSNMTAFSSVEERYTSKKGMKEGRRLSCQAMIEGDLLIDVPAESQVHKQVVRKRADVRQIEIDPPIQLHYVEVAEPDMHHPSGDLERLQSALEAQWGLTNLHCDLRTLQTLQPVLRKEKWQVTVAVENKKTIIAIWPGYKDNAYGIAVDLGSTTIAAHLCDLQTGEVTASSGIMNPQIRFGEDLMSRVSYVMMNPGGEKEMTATVRDALDTLIGVVASEGNIERSDILSMTFVGNPVMHHLLLGIDPTELGGAPFALTLNSSIHLYASELNLNISPDGRVYILPCIAGHVGADTAGVILSEGPHLQDEVTLICDVGTNAEIVLGNKDRLLACSSPTGPAFEGAQITSGQRAAPGAIERIRIDPVTLEPRYQVIGSDLWSDEEGFAEETKSSGVTGICGSGIIEAIGEMFLAGIIQTDGIIDGSKSSISPRVQSNGKTFDYIISEGEPLIKVTQTDVRAIQLAKAALYAGVKLLMEKLGVETIDRIQLAGAFGSHIDVKYAMVIGLIPDCELKRVKSAGNAAGTGARIALLNKQARTEIEDVVSKVEKIETAVEPNFQEHFVNAMGMPNTIDEFTNLSKIVTLPERKIGKAHSGEEQGRGRRRRRR